MAIFHHQDIDDDELEINTYRDFPNDLFVDVTRGYDREKSTVCIDRDAALHLHSVLGEWLYPVHTPEGPNRSLIEQMIEKAVKDQVAAILPLHLTPGASFRISGPCAGHVDGERDHDPEPGDVGHPRPAVSPCGLCGHEGSGHEEDCIHGQPEPVAKTCPHNICWGDMRCVRCRATDPEPEPVAEPHFPSLHMATESECRAVGCAAARHLSEPATQHGRDLPDELRRSIYGRLMAELPRRARPRMQRPEDWGPGIACGEKIRHGQFLADVHQACGYAWAMHPVAVPIPDKCQECLHGWVEHTSGICWGVGGDGNACRCTRERP